MLEAVYYCHQKGQLRGSGGCRQVVDATYAVLVRAMFTQLERTAVPDVKHGDRLRLENYTLFETELKLLASRVSGLPLSDQVCNLLNTYLFPAVC